MRLAIRKRHRANAVNWAHGNAPASSRICPGLKVSGSRRAWPSGTMATTRCESQDCPLTHPSYRRGHKLPLKAAVGARSIGRRSRWKRGSSDGGVPCHFAVSAAASLGP
eukprot:s718_g20.t1